MLRPVDRQATGRNHQRRIFLHTVVVPGASPRMLKDLQISFYARATGWRDKLATESIAALLRGATHALLGFCRGRVMRLVSPIANGSQDSDSEVTS